MDGVPADHASSRTSHNHRREGGETNDEPNGRGSATALHWSDPIPCGSQVLGILPTPRDRRSFSKEKGKKP